MKRTFIALPIKPGAEMVKAVSALTAYDWKAQIKWVPPEQWHFTLAFLGDTFPKTESRVKLILQGIASESIDPIMARFNTIGVFPVLRNPKVLWLGIEENPSLINFARRIQQGLFEGGVMFDSKAFVPHLTVGRVRKVYDYAGFKTCFHAFRLPALAEYRLDQLIYFQSVLEKNGPSYQALKIWSLYE